MAEPYRILVTGSRTWEDRAVLSFELGIAIGQSGRDLDDIVIVHGDCPRGADRIASLLALSYGYQEEPHPADWDQYGKAAGYRRNAEMVATRPDICLAFIRDGSRGATHCADAAEKAGIEVRRFTA